MLDPVTITAVVILGLLVVGGIAAYFFFRRRQMSQHEYKFQKLDDIHVVEEEQPNKPTKQNILSNIVRYIVGKLAEKGITVAEEAVKANLFGDNPEEKIKKDGTVKTEIKIKQNMDATQRIAVDDDDEQDKDISIRFRTFFPADEQLPTRNFEQNVQIAEKSNGSIKVTVSSTPGLRMSSDSE